MVRIPVDLARLGTVLALGVQPATDQQGQPRTDREGRPLSRVQVLVTPPAQADGYQPKPSVEEITVPAAPPLPAPMSPVGFESLSARMWEMNGRAGISLSADAVVYHRVRGGE